MRIKNNFHLTGFALSLTLKQKLAATRKWTTSSPGRFSPTSKARGKRPGDEVGKWTIALEEDNKSLTKSDHITFIMYFHNQRFDNPAYVVLVLNVQ